MKVIFTKLFFQFFILSHVQKNRTTNWKFENYIFKSFFGFYFQFFHYYSFIVRFFWKCSFLKGSLRFIDNTKSVWIHIFGPAPNTKNHISKYVFIHLLYWGRSRKYVFLNFLYCQWIVADLFLRAYYWIAFNFKVYKMKIFV